MITRIFTRLGVVALAATAFFMFEPRVQNAAAMNTDSPADANPLLEKWSGQWGGLPPFNLVKVYYDNFVHAGAALSPEKKTKLAEINQKLSGLYTSFNQNLQAEETQTMVIDRKEDLAGLPQSFIDGIAEAAKAKGMDGKWV